MARGSPRQGSDGHGTRIGMKTFIALFRGLNVGGNNVLAMKDLVSLLEDLGMVRPRTYIQSGNAVFGSDARGSARLAAEIRTAVDSAHGFEPEVLLLDTRELQRALTSNPLTEAENDPSRLLLYFLAGVPEHPDLEEIERIKSPSERFALLGAVFYLHAADGIGRSRLAARAEKLLGVPATARNWRTVLKLMEMAGDSG